MGPPSETESTRHEERFRDTFVNAIAYASVGYCALNVVSIYATGVRLVTVLYPAFGVLVGLIALFLVRAGRNPLATHLIFVGNALILASSMIQDGYPPLRGVGLQLFMLLVVLYSFLEGFGYGLFYVLLCVGSISIAPQDAALATNEKVLVAAMQGFALVTSWVCGGYAERYRANNERMLSERVEEMTLVVAETQRIAEGDLSLHQQTTPAVREMLEGLRILVSQALKSVRVLAGSASEVSTKSNLQAKHAIDQAAAVQQTQTTMESIDRSTESIAGSAKHVLTNAQRTLDAHRSAQELITELAQQEERAGEFLEMIKDVARRSEIIALNAALEGSRAGEAGRGFSLVAKEIQRLAASTTENVALVKDIITDIRRATEATITAIDSATGFAASTTDTAQQISLVAQQQASSTAQMLEAMRDISTITSAFAETSQETLSAMGALTDVSHQLETAVDRFHL